MALLTSSSIAPFEGTVRIWQQEPGYRLMQVTELEKLPFRTQGVFALLSDETVLLVDVVDQVYTPAKAIERALVRPEVQQRSPSHVAFMSFVSWTEALAEWRRLRAFYYIPVATRAR